MLPWVFPESTSGEGGTPQASSSRDQHVEMFRGVERRSSGGSCQGGSEGGLLKCVT
jgi:hypothetical protein